MVLASSGLMKSKDSKSITCSKFHPLPSKSGGKKKKRQPFIFISDLLECLKKCLFSADRIPKHVYSGRTPGFLKKRKRK